MKHTSPCPACGSTNVRRATRAQCKAAHASTANFALQMACGDCGNVFEVVWPAWWLYFTLISAWLLLVASPILAGMVLLGGGDLAAAGEFMIPMLVGAILLPPARRQRRLHRSRGSGQPV